MTETIQQLKEDIAILQEKLQKLETQQEPQMTLKKSGDCDVISYDHKYYYRLSFGVGDFYWYKRYIGSPNLMRVEDPEEHRLLEELYDGVILDTGGVVEPEKRKIDDLAEKLLPDDHPYKIADEHGETNPYKQYLHSINDERKMEELGFVKNDEGYWKAQPLVEHRPIEKYHYKKCTPEETEQSLKEAFREVQQTEEWKETQKKIDSPKESCMNRPIVELVDTLEEKPTECLRSEQGKTLYDICVEWCDDDSQPTVSELIDRIEKWLPHEQDSFGSQRIETVIAVDVHNQLLREIKSKLRNRD